MNFPQCLADTKSCANSSSNCTLNISNTTAFSDLLTNQGHHVNSTDEATALSYTGCTRYCGTGLENFHWTSFAKDYAAWLLPYLALVSQLPFGAQRRMDNFMSALLTLGSPTLAGYSLYMTLLNARWVNDQLFAGIDYPTPTVRRSVVRVLSTLQQVPLRVHPGSGRFESLIVHPDNDDWWNTLAEELDFSHGWSIASAASTAWVLIAYILSVVISISDIHYNESCSQATGSGLLWLLPIVVGWLVLSPKCDYDRVQNAYSKANRQVFVADPDDPITVPSHITSNFSLTISPRPDSGSHIRSIASPDEARIPPVFNYARTFSWYQNVYVTSLFYRTAWRKSNDRIGVDGKLIPGNGHNGVPRAGRLGTREEIVGYCQPGDREHSGSNVLWPRGLFFNMVVASLMSLQLQWGTTGAAILVLWFTPTVGLGCRSLAYLIYRVQSTAVWMLLVLSSALGYYAHNLLGDQPVLDTGNIGEPTYDASPRVAVGENRLAIPLFEVRVPSGHPEREGAQINTNLDPGAISGPFKHLRMRRTYGQVIYRVADWPRWIGKTLAIINAISIIANSVIQYAGLYSNCYCDSGVYTLSAYAFVVIDHMPSDTDLAKKAWIGGLALSLASCSFFVLSIYLVRDSLP